MRIEAQRKIGLQERCWRLTLTADSEAEEEYLAELMRRMQDGRWPGWAPGGDAEGR